MLCTSIFHNSNKRMKNVIVIAEEGDIIGEKKLIGLYLQGEMVDNQWHATDGSVWDILVTGVGALNVMWSLRDMPRDTRLLNIGYAGSANFEIGSLVEATEVRLNHPCVKYPEPEMHLMPVDAALLQEPDNVLHAMCYSNTDFVLQSDYTDCVFDMELAFMAGMGFTRLSALKIVSDNLSLHKYRQVAAEGKTPK